jgi:hypothetical protein
MQVRRALAAAVSLAFFVACQAEDDLEDSDQAVEGSALVCTSPPVPRTYIAFDQNKLEQRRPDEAVDVNRARFKPFAVMAEEYKRVLGAAPKSLAGAREAFGDAPERWYAEPTHSGVSLSAIFNVGLDGCTATIAADRSKAPTNETATAFCKDLMTKAYSEDPTAEQVAVCVDLATTKLANVTDVRSRWAQVCASILSSTPFLTY